MSNPKMQYLHHLKEILSYTRECKTILKQFKYDHNYADHSVSSQYYDTVYANMSLWNVPVPNSEGDWYNKENSKYFEEGRMRTAEAGEMADEGLGLLSKLHMVIDIRLDEVDMSVQEGEDKEAEVLLAEVRAVRKLLWAQRST